MFLKIDTESAVPIYAQIVAQVKRMIASGVLRAGDTLPSLRELATHLRINPLTVAKAYRELEAQGIVQTEHGRGSFISLRTPQFGEQYRREALVRAVDRMLVEACQLGVSEDQIVETIRDRIQQFPHSQPEDEQ